jgi:hypothetical protein
MGLASYLKTFDRRLDSAVACKSFCCECERFKLVLFKKEKTASVKKSYTFKAADHPLVSESSYTAIPNW